jgi:hypothetical protein
MNNNKNIENFKIDNQLLPDNDLIFSRMFEDKNLFESLMKSVLGKKEKLQLVNEPLSQVAKKNVLKNTSLKTRLNSIRLDVQADGKNKIYTADLQNSGNFEDALARTIYYAMRIYSTQEIKNMNYKAVKPVCVNFLMTHAKENNNENVETKNGIQKIGISNLTTGKNYPEMFDVYVVFVPSVIQTYQKQKIDKNDDLYIFSKFWGANTQKKANEFYNKFKV